jgi:hypothetical protein
MSLLVSVFKKYKEQIISLLFKNLVPNKLYIYDSKLLKIQLRNKDNNKLNLLMIVLLI